MLVLILVQDGPRAGDTVYQVSDLDILAWFELDGTPILEPVESWAIAYTCADPNPPAPAWYNP